ncbi:copper chaperone PCu(A)C [Methylobacterium terricola]|uniref:Copper chaperone PCu(A)C n=1 Tax=Methylobacterium terricola TaxID=2583531 RepID=A0A5C4LCF7_9HYPH|nr:copper chaperone PCu(A)C [Methylobacterium terricola]TNC10273.1 copper chaperone PCu(A)C [Methylobacterium terricola]
MDASIHAARRCRHGHAMPLMTRPLYFWKVAAGVAVALCLGRVPAFAGDIDVVHAFVAPTETVGSDIPLHLTVTNRATEADSLVRFRCPFANFSERVTVDKGGEGPPSKRPIQTIAVKAAGETALTPEGMHVMLLQTRQPLVAGERFTCQASFRKAGAVEVPVEVRASR